MKTLTAEEGMEGINGDGKNKMHFEKFNFQS